MKAIKLMLGCFFFLPAYMISQNLSGSQIEKIKKNIVFFYIKNSNRYLSDSFSEDNCCYINIDEKINSILPDKNQELNIDILVSEIKLPDSKIKVYEIKNDNFSFVNTEKETIEKHSFFDGVPLAYQYSRIYLVGIEPKNKSLLYISGMFYCSPISKYFKLDSKRPDTFLNYLRIKYYNYKIVDLKYIKSSSKFLYYKGKSIISNNELKIKVNKNDFDDIELLI